MQARRVHPVHLAKSALGLAFLLGVWAHFGISRAEAVTSTETRRSSGNNITSAGLPGEWGAAGSSTQTLSHVLCSTSVLKALLQLMDDSVEGKQDVKIWAQGIWEREIARINHTYILSTSLSPLSSTSAAATAAENIAQNKTCGIWNQNSLLLEGAEQILKRDTTIVSLSIDFQELSDPRTRVSQKLEWHLRVWRRANGTVQSTAACDPSHLDSDSDSDIPKWDAKSRVVTATEPTPTGGSPDASPSTTNSFSQPSLGDQVPTLTLTSPNFTSDDSWTFYCQASNENSAVLAAYASSLESDAGDGLLTFRGEIRIEVDLTQIKVDPCNTSLSAWQHRCPPNSKCVPMPGGLGLRPGAYDCRCETGLCVVKTSPSRRSPAQQQREHHEPQGGTGEQHQQRPHHGASTSQAGMTLDQQQLLRDWDDCNSGSSNSSSNNRCSNISSITQPLPSVNDYDIQCLPCPRECNASRDIFQTECLGQPAMVFRILVVVFAVVTLLAILVTMLLLYRFRKEKIIRAASPSLLFSTLIGCLILDGELLVVVFEADGVTCMLRPWFRHVGFCISYGALVLKTWRVAVILNTFKARMLQTHDAQLHKKVFLMLCACVSYMTVWTAVDPVKVIDPEAEMCQCSLQWWEIVILVGELSLVSWGGHLCHKARKAPDLYNEARPVSYALWNEGLWVLFYLLAIVGLDRHEDPDMWLALHFIRVQLTVPVTILLLFVPKFYFIFRSVRELHGTLTDVYGARRVHRFSLLVSKKGEVKTIHCVPCGPLAYMEKEDEDDSSDTSSHDSRNAKETEYTRAEVDTLIAMVASLKRERELYKMQVRRLLRVVTEYKRKTPNGVPASLLAELPEADSMQDLHRHQACYDRSLTNYDSGIASGGEGGVIAGPSRTGLHSRKASTVSTFLSSSPETTSVANESSSHSGPRETFGLPKDANYNSGSNCIQLSMWNELMPVCSNVAGFPKGDHKLKLLEHQHLQPQQQQQQEQQQPQETKILSDATEDFPKLIHSHDSNCDNNNKLVVDNTSSSPFIPAVCSSVLPAAAVEDTHELQDIATSRNPGKHTRKASADSSNFVMYI